MKVASYTNAQLTAPGNGSKILLNRIKPASVEMQVTVATIDTNVVVRMDYSNDDFSTSVKGQEFTITANGAYVFSVPVGYDQCRPVFVSESGGTAATVDVVTRLHY